MYTGLKYLPVVGVCVWFGRTSKFIWHGDGTPCIMLCTRTSELSEYFWGRLYKVTVFA